MQSSEPGREHTVHLFGKRLAHITRAQACFHVRHWNARIKCSQRAAQSGGGVALHYHQIRPLGREHFFQRR